MYLFCWQNVVYIKQGLKCVCASGYCCTGCFYGLEASLSTCKISCPWLITLWLAESNLPWLRPDTLHPPGRTPSWGGGSGLIPNTLREINIFSGLVPYTLGGRGGGIRTFSGLIPYTIGEIRTFDMTLSNHGPSSIDRLPLVVVFLSSCTVWNH